MAIRRALHLAGLRYYVDRQPESDLRTRADIVFPRYRVAVFVDGCYWHGCEKHGTTPKSNADWWRAKIRKNQERDVYYDRVLRERRWQYFVFGGTIKLMTSRNRYATSSHAPASVLDKPLVALEIAHEG